jgi:uncharacterized protein (DUF697 family)
MLGRLWQRARDLWSGPDREAELKPFLDRVRQLAPVPVFWLFGKTQSGKTSIVKSLTGAESAEIGKGFQPCTHFSRRYEFPTPEAPLLSFLDTRGLDEPGYDPAEDITRFNHEAHLVVVVVRALDHAQENVLRHLKTLRSARRNRPVVLVLTTLHEAYPQQQHPLPYSFDALAEPVPGAPTPSPDLLRSMLEQKHRFSGLYDRVVAVDLTPADEGFNDPDYGGPQLRQVLIDLLPDAQAQTLRNLGEALTSLQDAFVRRAMPTILSYSSLATTVGALPIPFVDVVMLSGLQSRMIYALARLYGQPLTAGRFLEVAGSLGLGLLMRMGARSAVKNIPWVGTILGSVTGGVMGGASTYALGRAFCYYYQAVLAGHVPNAEDLRRYYRGELDAAQKRLSEQGIPGVTGTAPKPDAPARESNPGPGDPLAETIDWTGPTAAPAAQRPTGEKP